MSKERKMTDLEFRQREVNTDIMGVLKKNPKSGTEQRFQDIIKKILKKMILRNKRCSRGNTDEEWLTGR